MKKKVMIILTIIVMMILLIPVPIRLKDGGSVEYKAIIYKITDVHRLNSESTTGYEDGFIIEIFGIEIFNNVSYEKIVEEEKEEESGYIEEDIIIKDIDGKDTNYEFIYKEETFKVFYTYDNWKIYDSYKIKNTSDMKKICQALIDIHPIHGSDMISYRSADDMVYEWVQHNLAYEILPESNSWKNNAKDVDFDPKDQGKSIAEIYEDRMGNKLNFDNQN